MEKLKKQRNIAWIGCIVSFAMIFVFAFIEIAYSSPLSSPVSFFSFMPFLSFVSFIFCLIVAIYMTVKYSKNRRKLLRGDSQNSQKSQNGRAYSVVSLVCAIFLTLVPATILINAMQKPPQGGPDVRGLEVLFYYIFAGIPLFLAWLIFGILGIKSNKRNLAIVSLISVPIYYVIYFLVGWVQTQTR